MVSTPGWMGAVDYGTQVSLAAVMQCTHALSTLPRRDEEERHAIGEDGEGTRRTGGR